MAGACCWVAVSFRSASRTARTWCTSAPAAIRRSRVFPDSSNVATAVRPHAADTVQMFISPTATSYRLHIVNLKNSTRYNAHIRHGTFKSAQCRYRRVACACAYVWLCISHRRRLHVYCKFNVNLSIILQCHK